MQKVLFIALCLALHSLITGTAVFAGDSSTEAQKLKYEYIISTELSAEKFADFFCDRLAEKHKWQKINSRVSSDETYTNIFSFKDANAHSWECEVTIQKNREISNTMDVVMIVEPVLES